MKVRQSTVNDLPIIMETINIARQVMRDNGNDVQWTNGYPSQELMLSNITQGFNYLIENDNNEILATFDFITGEEPNYKTIVDGSWLNDKPYGVIHRLATNGKEKGIAAFCFNWAFSQLNNIKIDTHESNMVMQIVLKKLGYTQCGVIYVEDGSPRLAFQKSI